MKFAHMFGSVNTFRTLCVGVLAALAVSACGVGPKATAPVGSYDFGVPASQSPTKLSALSVIEVNAARWLDSTNVYYRLAYADGARPMAYTQTRWVMSPANLIEARLKAQAVGAGVRVGGSGPVLKIEIDEFTQVFDSEKTSKAVVRARATLMNGRDVVRQRAFSIDQAAGSADGPGGAAALARAGDALITGVLAWAGN